MSEESVGAGRRKRNRLSGAKYSAATITRWRQPLLEAVRLGADQSDMPVAAFIRFAVKKELRRIGVSVGS